MVGHDALVGLVGDEAFEAADDVFLGEAFGAAPSDVVNGGLVEAHTHDHDPVERCVRLAVTVGLAGGGGDGAGSAEFRERGLGVDPVGVVAEALEGLPQRRRHVDDQRLERDDGGGFRFAGGVSGDFELADHLHGPVSGLRQSGRLPDSTARAAASVSPGSVLPLLRRSRRCSLLTSTTRWPRRRR